uniref:Bulb-type lectin domain-containing protein n=1 Tax=Salmo trutta TaxID=8032 RepID=A0A674B3E1_SALTR
MSRNYLCKNDELRKGDFILSNNRDWKAVFQVRYFYMSIPMWSSDTAGPNRHRLCMTPPVWHTNTSKLSCKTCRIHLKDDGTLVLEKNRVDIWSSNESSDMK